MSTAGGRITASAGANLIGVHSADRNQEATCYVGNIDPQANEELIWELFVQAGPVGGCWECCRAARGLPGGQGDWGGACSRQPATAAAAGRALSPAHQLLPHNPYTTLLQ